MVNHIFKYIPSLFLVFTLINASYSQGVDTIYFDQTRAVRELIEKDAKGNVTAKRGFYETGERKFIEHFSNGNINGQQLFYFKSGKIREENNYYDGLSQGEQISWFESGEIKSKSNCSYDTCEEYSYYIDGKMESVKKTILGKMYYFENWCENGQIIEKIEIDGSPHGYVKYHCNGNVMYKGTLLYENVFIGKFEQFYENGKLYTAGQYLNKGKDTFGTIPIKHWEFYNEDGKKVQSIDYDDEGNIIKQEKY